MMRTAITVTIHDQGWQEGRDAMTAEIERAAQKWIGGEG